MHIIVPHMEQLEAMRLFATLGQSGQLRIDSRCRVASDSYR
jgi:hypothetical protein